MRRDTWSRILELKMPCIPGYCNHTLSLHGRHRIVHEVKADLAEGFTVALDNGIGGYFRLHTNLSPLLSASVDNIIDDGAGREGLTDKRLLARKAKNVVDHPRKTHDLFGKETKRPIAALRIVLSNEDIHRRFNDGQRVLEFMRQFRAGSSQECKAFVSTGRFEGELCASGNQQQRSQE